MRVDIDKLAQLGAPKHAAQVFRAVDAKSGEPVGQMILRFFDDTGRAVVVIMSLHEAALLGLQVSGALAADQAQIPPTIPVEPKPSVMM